MRFELCDEIIDRLTGFDEKNDPLGVKIGLERAGAGRDSQTHPWGLELLAQLLYGVGTLDLGACETTTTMTRRGKGRWMAEWQWERDDDDQGDIGGVTKHRHGRGHRLQQQRRYESDPSSTRAQGDVRNRVPKTTSEDDVIRHSDQHAPGLAAPLTLGLVFEEVVDLGGSPVVRADFEALRKDGVRMVWMGGRQRKVKGRTLSFMLRIKF